MKTYSKRLDVLEVLIAWQQLPGSDKGISVREALRMAKHSPEICPKLVAVLSKTAKHHRSRALANALMYAVYWGEDGWPQVKVVQTRPIKIRKLRKNAKRRYRTRTPDAYLETPVDSYIVR